MTALDDIRGRWAKATPGPWFLDVEGNSGIYTEPRVSATSNDVASAFRAEDEEFIAHAPTDVARLLAAVEAVTTLHYQQEDEEEVLAWQCVDGPCEHGDDMCPEVMIKPCAECSTPGEMYYGWPCPTVKALTAVLEAP